MTIKEFTKKLENGAHHLLIYDTNGEILCKTIWYNEIPEKILNREIENIRFKNYDIYVEVN